MSKIDAPERSRTWMWIAVVVLAALHQDFWWWDTRTLVFGILPIGLFYHMLFSLSAAALWFAAVKWAWPGEIEAWADEAASDGASAGEGDV